MQSLAGYEFYFVGTRSSNFLMKSYCIFSNEKTAKIALAEMLAEMPIELERILHFLSTRDNYTRKT